MCTKTPSAVMISTRTDQQRETYLRQVIFASFIVKERYKVEGGGETSRTRYKNTCEILQ